jgi:hypothetical protein
MEWSAALRCCTALRGALQKGAGGPSLQRGAPDSTPRSGGAPKQCPHHCYSAAAQHDSTHEQRCITQKRKKLLAEKEGEEAASRQFWIQAAGQQR